MKKFYAQVKTSSGIISLVVKSTDEESAKSKIYKEYKINEIIQISNQPIRIEGGKITSSCTNTMGFINRNSSKTTKRFNQWGLA